MHIFATSSQPNHKRDLHIFYSAFYGKDACVKSQLPMIDFLTRWSTGPFVGALLLLLCVSPVCVHAFSLPTAQKQALYDLYTATNGPKWRWKLPYLLYGSQWNFSAPNYNPCDGWQGVTCNSNCKFSACNVIKLQLDDNEMDGLVTSSLSSLTSLTTLALESNKKLRGEIPPELKSLTQLTFLSFASCNMSGTIPGVIFEHLRLLKSVTLDANELSGTIPLSLTTLPKLQNLFLYKNRLHGTIPPALGNLTSLRSLNLSENHLTGTIPPQLGQCIHLEELYLEKSLLHGPIPASLGQLVNLTTMVFDGNSLTGSIPTTLAAAKRIHDFQVQNNFLTGHVDPAFFETPHLGDFLVDENLITGTIPSNLGSSLLLWSVVFSGNKMHGTIPDGVGSLVTMVGFKVDNNFISGTLPSGMQNWVKLREIYVQKTNIGGTLPQWISNWVNLTQLSAFESEFEGALPQSLTSLHQAYLIYLFGNRFNGTLPSSRWSNMHKLVQLQLQENYLTGTIPMSLCDAPKLRGLVLSKNRLRGAIPTCLDRIPVLQSIQLFGNKLSGTIPGSIGNMLSLELFEIENNRITGSIPAGITNLTSLLIFAADSNFLTGSLPNGIDTMLVLTELSTSFNLMTGTLPLPPPFTTKVLLRGNSFHGSLSDLWWNTSKGIFDVEINELEGNLTGLFSRPLLPSRISISRNQFTGQFLAHVDQHSINSQLNPLLFINSSTNYFTGPIGSHLNKLISLTELYGSFNFFTGTIPSDVFRTMQNLSTLEMENNLLTGPLPDPLVNTTADFFILNINSNSFTGTVPDSIFTINNLQSVVMSLNCFSGTLPATLCHSEGLVDVLLDGLHASPHCHYERFLDTHFHVDIFENGWQVHGSIPTCVWQLPNLQVLHLSGNSLQGSITLPTENVLVTYNATIGWNKRIEVTTNKSVAFVSESLVNVDLSHNRLTGTIPHALWVRNFSTLDLSFNRLHGTIPSVVSPAYLYNNESSLYLEVNRLSGSIPETLLSVQSINILEGNLFGCSMSDRAHTLPTNDPNFNNYQCGSQYTDISMIAFGATFLVVIFAVIVRYVRYERPLARQLAAAAAALSGGDQHKEATTAAVATESSVAGGGDGAVPLWTRYVTWMAMYGDVQGLRDGQIAYIVFGGIVLQRWIVWLRVVMLVVVFVGMPLFVLLSTFYGTYDHQYIWTVSATFLSGPVPAGLLLAFFIGLIAIVMRMNPAYQPAIVVPGDPNAIDVAAAADGEERSTLARDTQASRPTETPPSSKSSFVRSSSQASEVSSFVLPRASESLSWHWPTLALNTVFILTNIVVVVSVNAAYIVAINHQYDGPTLVFISLALSLFKIAWGALLTFFYQRVLRHDDENAYTLSLISLTIFNNIVAPYLADMIISPDCFKYALQSSPPVTSTAGGVPCYYVISGVDEVGQDLEVSSQLEYLICQVSPVVPNATILAEYQTSTTIEYTPAFTYNYQCSSSVITSFAYIFILRYTLGGIVLPLLQLAMKWWVHRQLSTTTAASPAAAPSLPPSPARRWATVVNGLLPPLMQLHYLPRDEVFAEPSSSCAASPSPSPSSTLSPPSSTENPLHATVADGSVATDAHVQHNHSGGPASPPLGLVDSVVAWNLSLLETSLLRKPLNPAQQLRVIVARDFAVLLTFGVLFPPLLVIIALAMVVQIHMIQMFLGRLHAMTPSTTSPLTVATRSYGHRLQQWLQKANLSFADFDRGLWQGLAMSVSVAAVFWSLSLFDILADSDGGNNAVHAVWILMVMVTAPAWMYALDVAWRRGSQTSWSCPLLQQTPSAGEVGTATGATTVNDDDEMAADGDDIEMRSTRDTTSTRPTTLSTVHLRPSEARSLSTGP